ncbi:response regulator [Flavobacteriaceae bacterium R33]|uniref:histidine kinase n=2 Tax=Poritiphilus flavus TaxID=2697053 RepID=A0A6L9EE85_9FLAO|nr:response regulator [Poritiphilus flavus]
MNERSRNKFNLKIVLSYIVLGILTTVIGFFIFSEIKVYLFPETVDQSDSKLLKTSSLLTRLYEAESLSKLALQTKTGTNFKAYSLKIDSICVEIDTLKGLSESSYQIGLLDSVQTLLLQKVANSNELRNLKARNDANSSLDAALEEFKRMEASLGRITPEALAPNLSELSPKAQSVIRDIADYLNENVPKNENDPMNAEKVDSILNVSKALLNQAKLTDSRKQRSLEQKEAKINQNDMELSQKLRSIIAAFEQEVMVNTYNANVRKQAAVRRSLRLAGLAALLGFLIVGVFTFLINRDFWKIQTYRQRLEQEKKYSESLLKSREQLISTVSHDLRTPLSSISGYSELIDSTELSEKQRLYLKQVRSSSEYVESLVNDLLDFSKLEAGKIKVETIPFILSEVLHQTAENLRELYRNKPVSLILDIDEQLEKPVIGDPHRIRQIVTNLVGNAYKFTHKGHVKLEASFTKVQDLNCMVVIKVIDSGIGIQKEKQQYIFREFTQAEVDIEKKYGGYGLGLTISKKLATLLGGSINLQSEEGKGSTFILELPLKISEIPVVKQKEKLIRLSKPFTILIIDDDSSLLQLLKEVCSGLGIQAHTFSDFEEITTDASLDYNMVLTDIQMPRIDGFEVLKRLNSEAYNHFKGQAVLAMTGRRDLNPDRYKKEGFAEVISKPFTKQQFLEVLQQLFPSHFSLEESNEKTIATEEQGGLYSLDVIASFLGENTAAMDEVLYTFIKDTETNLAKLSEAISGSDFGNINDIAHRMLPMFRQLKVAEAVKDLEELEVIEESELEANMPLEAFLQRLETTTKALLDSLKERISKSPTYSN